jgi:hypothetical protein
MKMILKSTFAAAALASAAIMIPATATAGVDVSVGIDVPGVFYAPGAGYSPYEGSMYYDPIYFDGGWYHGPYRWRTEHGHRVFWLDGGWHRNEWRGGPIPGSLTFRNGGYYRGGRYDGFVDAERINARFPADRGAVGADHPDMARGRPEMGTDRPDMAHDRAVVQPDRMNKPGPAGSDTGRDDRPDGPHN